jgi:tetratricopeptide (TPR) repeat protein
MAGFTELTRRLMDDRGISVRRLAELVHYDDGGMSKILRGLQSCPPYLARAMDDALGAGGAITAAAARAPAPPPDTEKARRALEAALAGGMMSAGLLAGWEASADRYGYRTRDTPSPVLLADLTGDLQDLRLAMERHRSASALPRLALVAARMSGLVCLVLIRAGDRQAFRRWGRTARHAAVEAADGTAQSWAMAQEAYGYYYADDMPAAIACARGALEAARHPCVGGALAAALEMRAHAAMGDAASARRALHEAERIHARLSGPDVAASAFGYGESQLRFHAGDALTRLGDTAAARPVLEKALRLCAPDDYTDRSLVLLDLAACIAADGDWDAALTAASRVLENLDAARLQGIIAGRARELLAAVPAPARALPVARGFRDLLDDSTGAKEITPP